ncbi:CP family cyanate transporter-like MFS transporter [Rossellomorea marisflavi]
MQEAKQQQAGWIAVIGVIFIAMNLRAPITSVGPLIPLIQGDFHFSNAVAGSIMTIPLIAFALFSPIAPRLSLKFGLEPVIYIALLVLLAGMVLRVFPHGSWLFVGTGLVGIAIAICNVLMPALVKKSFPLKVGLITGVYGISMNVFGSLASGVSVPLAQSSSLSWRASLGIWAFLAVLSVILWSFLLKSVKKEKMIEPPAVKVRMWNSLKAWHVTIFMGIQSFMFYTLLTWLPAILHDQGYTLNQAGWVVSTLQMAIIPMTFIIPVVAEKMSDQRWLTIGSVILLFLGLIGLITGFLTVLSVLLIGVGIGTMFGLAMMFFVLRTTDSAQAAGLSGMAQSMGYLLAAVGPVFFGYLHDLFANWTIPFILLMLLTLIQLFVGIGASKGKLE